MMSVRMICALDCLRVAVRTLPESRGGVLGGVKCDIENSCCWLEKEQENNEVLFSLKEISETKD